MKLELETYTPSEAEAITAVKQATVRNWRRAGHLPRQEGHARYNLADMLVMFVMGMLVSRGTTPDAAREFAGHAARAIFQSTIWSPKAFSDAVREKAKAELGKVSDDGVSCIKEGYVENSNEENLETHESMGIQKHIVEAAEKMAGMTGLRHPTWLIVWANGEIQFYYDEDISEETFFGNTVFDEFVQGPVMLFCLGALAQMVIDRLPRPAFRLAEGA